MTLILTLYYKKKRKNNNNGETKETEECKEASSEMRRVGLRYDHRYDHTMAIILSQISLGKGSKDFGDRAIDATTKEFS